MIDTLMKHLLTFGQHSATRLQLLCAYFHCHTQKVLETGFRSCLRLIPPTLRSSATSSTSSAATTASVGKAASLVGLVAAAPQALQRVLLLLSTPDAIAVTKTCTTLATAASASTSAAITSSATAANAVSSRGWHAGGEADKSKAKGAYLHTLANFTTVQVLLLILLQHFLHYACKHRSMCHHASIEQLAVTVYKAQCTQTSGNQLTILAAGMVIISALTAHVC
jgi:hypothetical protein